MQFLLIRKTYSSFEIDVPKDADHDTIAGLVRKALDTPMDHGPESNPYGFREFDDADEVYGPDNTDFTPA